MTAARAKPTVWAIVADSDQAFRDELADQLESVGFGAIRCNTTDELLAGLMQVDEAIVFIDIRFDRKNAIEMLPSLLAQAARDEKRLVVLALSGVAGSNFALSATKAGAFRYLAKPIRPALLNIVLKDALMELREAKARPVVPVAAPQPPAAAPAPPEPEVESAVIADAVQAVHEHSQEVPDALAGIKRPITASTSVDCTPLDEQGLTPGRRYRMERMVIVSDVPDEPGVITFYDESVTPLAVEYASSVSQRLNYYVELHPAMSDIARRAHYFEILPTMDREQEAKIFDRLVNRFGQFPSLMKEAPEGSSHYGHQEPHVAPPPSLQELGANTDEPLGTSSVTEYNATPDAKMLDGIREILAQNPNDPETQDWLAFTLYSNNLFDEAIAWYTKLITGGSRHEEHFFYCGNAFFKKGDVKRAMKLWLVAAEMNPGSVIAKKSRQRIREAAKDS